MSLFLLKPNQLTQLNPTHLLIRSKTMSTLVLEEPKAILIADVGSRKITREELTLVETPAPTVSHKPIPHIQVINALVETLSFRHIDVVRDEYAISINGMKMFGALDLSQEMDGARFSIGIRNSNDKTLRLALTVGYRVVVCSNLAFQGDFMPLLAKHSANFELLDGLAIAVDRIQRSFLGIQNQVRTWKGLPLSDIEAKALIYEAFIEERLDVPKALVKSVHEHYFNPIYPEFEGRNLWSLSNAFTSAFKELSPTGYFQASAKLGNFLARFK